MSVIPITCDNCGAKYKLPPTFKGTQAKCQKCGSVIDVQKQREAATAGDSPAAAAKPAKARPASGAKPAVARSQRRSAAASSAADKPARAGSGRSRRSGKDDDDAETPRRSREKKKDNTPMILAGVGLVVIVIALLLVMGGGDDKKKPEEEASTNPATNTDTADANANKQDTNPGAADTVANAADKAAPDSAAAGAAGADAKPAAADKPADDAQPTADPTKVTEPPAPPPIEPAIPGGKKEPWMKQRNPPQTMSQVQSAAEMYGEVIWPESIDATKKAEILEIVADLDASGGIRSIRAKAKLVKAGYPGLFGILEALQKLDYRQASDAAFGFELNKALEDLTGGLNARYAAVQTDEEMHPAKALWNTKTVKAWMATFAKWPDAAAFRKAKAERAKKRRG